jgi:hypothetical protein
MIRGFLLFTGHNIKILWLKLDSQIHNPYKKSPFYLDVFDNDALDREISEIEKELEDKLWELFYKMKKQNYRHSTFSKSFFDV